MARCRGVMRQKVRMIWSLRDSSFVQAWRCHGRLDDEEEDVGRRTRALERRRLDASADVDMGVARDQGGDGDESCLEGDTARPSAVDR